MYWGDEIVLWGLLSIATVTDLAWGKVPNALTFPAMVAGLSSRAYLHGWEGLVAAVMGTFAAFVLFFPFYYFRIFGAGDVKLLMAVGACSDTAFVLRLAMPAIFFGAAVGVVVLLQKRGGVGALTSLRDHLRPKGAGPISARMPFAPAFFCAAIWLQIAKEYAWSAW